MVSSLQMEPVSRTDQYKRVMKPLLERKRRARINRCLDELRDLLVSALQAEGETVTRLEKADILELTVRHVRRLNQRRRLTLPQAAAAAQHDPRHDALKFQQGFVAAAQQVQSFLMASPSLEPQASARLITHLTSCATTMVGATAAAVSAATGGAPSMQTAPALPARPIASHPVMVPKTSPPTTPPSPPLIDLSMKHHTVHQPRPVQMPRLVAPTPRRESPTSFAHTAPQDLSVRRSPPYSPQYESTDKVFRPW